MTKLEIFEKWFNILASLMLIGTLIFAGLQWRETAHSVTAQKKSIVSQTDFNKAVLRPHLEVSFDSGYVDMLSDAIYWVYSIKNHGDKPAYRVAHSSILSPNVEYPHKLFNSLYKDFKDSTREFWIIYPQKTVSTKRRKIAYSKVNLPSPGIVGFKELGGLINKQCLFSHFCIIYNGVFKETKILKATYKIIYNKEINKFIIQYVSVTENESSEIQ